MSLTLAGAKPKLQADIMQCAHDAIKEAYMTSISSGEADPVIATKIKADAQIASEKYATEFAKSLAPKLADAIYNFVKEISITLTPTGTLIAPQAPAGSLPVTGVSGTEIGDIKVI